MMIGCDHRPMFTVYCSEGIKFLHEGEGRAPSVSFILCSMYAAARQYQNNNSVYFHKVVKIAKQMCRGPGGGAPAGGGAGGALPPSDALRGLQSGTL